MRRLIALAIVALLVSASASFAGKSLVRVYFDDLDHRRAVVSQFEDVAGWGGKRYADIVVHTDELGDLNLLAPNNEVLIYDIDKHMREMGVLGVGGTFHTYEETYTDMDSVATAYPSICQLQSLGTSHEGRDIWGMKISDNVGTTEDEPRVLYLGAHHAREIITPEIPLYIMYWLVQNYGTDSLATFLVDNREIWIVPLMNPDGREYVEHTGDWRKNRRDNGGSYGVDLNRNWCYMWGYDDVGSSPTPSDETYRGPSACSEPETQAIRDLMETYEFSTCISYHSHGDLILWAWGYTPALCPDHDVLSALGDSMAAHNGYAPGTGAGLYATNGDSDDWMYGEQTTKEKVYSFTFEVSDAFYPPAADIIPLCQENLVPSLLAAEYAGNVRRILPPGTPVIASMPDDDDGAYSVTWTPDTSDTINPAVQFALMERTGPAIVTDDVEAGDVNWARQKFLLSTARASSGVQSFYGGHTNDRNARLTSGIAIDVEAGDTLFFDTWYEIETDWDYAYVEVSTDGGILFRPIPGNITTTYNPNGSNAGNGITGNSGGWVQAAFPLDAFADTTTVVRFRYKTDSYVLEEGIYVDDIYPTQTFTSSVILSNAITNTYYDVTNGVGAYYYEVMARDDDGQWGYWSQRESITVTGAGVGDITQVDEDRGFANPVYLGTTVRLAASGLTTESISIFDVRGRVIRELQIASSGEASWDLKDEQGNPVTPGIYFVLSGPDGKPAARKVVILK
ncbi:MAG: M14 family zinc carboxypeptidase [Candidatus Eisenbacteria bacterium]